TRCAAIVAQDQLTVPAHVGALRARAGEGHIVHIEIVQAVDNLGPRVAAVEAPEDAVDLDAGPDDSRIVRVDEDAGHEGLSDGALGRDGDVQSLPGCSAVARAIDRCRAGASEERPS